MLFSTPLGSSGNADAAHKS